jgi:hypothetical protein
MKKTIFLLSLTILACTGTGESTDQQQDATHIASAEAVQHADETPKDASWTGTIQSNIPVFIQYTIEDDLVIGEITYLNTSTKTPIKLLGTIQADKEYRLLEFDSSGNITGVIVGSPNDKQFNGSWFSPKTHKELSLTLTKKDTTLSLENIHANTADIFGSYHYQYGTEGFQGDFQIKELQDKQAAFNIFSVTSAPARNIADVPEDTIELNSTAFIYNIAESEDCGFKVTFFKDFVYIKYTHGYCTSQFGHNATVDGIYLKTKR